MKRLLYLFAAFAVVAGGGVLTSCDEPIETPEGGDEGGDQVKSVVVGTQTGTLTAGQAGSVTFEVTTENIEAGNYSATITPKPTGIEVDGEVAVGDDGKGTLTLSGDATTQRGTHNLKLTIDGTESNFSFTLTIAKAPANPEDEIIIAFEPQTLAITAGEQKSNVQINFVVTQGVIYPEGITSNPRKPFMLNASHFSGFPSWINNMNGYVNRPDMEPGLGGIIFNVGPACVEGSYTGALVIPEYDVNAEFTIVVGPGAKKISVGTQSVSVVAGTIVNNITYNFTTSGGDFSGGTATPLNASNLSGLPTGVVFVSGAVNSPAAGQGRVVIKTNMMCEEGNHTITLTIDGVSTQFSLKIDADSLPESITVGAQYEPITVGTSGAVYFDLTTENLELSTANGTYTAANFTNLPAGLSFTSFSVTSSTKATVMFMADGDLIAAGAHTITLTIDGVSDDFDFVVTPAASAGDKTLAVSLLSGTATEGGSGAMIQYSISSTGIAAISSLGASYFTGLPAGASILSGKINANGSGSFAVYFGTAPTADTYPVTLTVEGVSAIFDVVVGPTTR